jgi:tetratricopeptide (TPR) repeat protein
MNRGILAALMVMGVVIFVLIAVIALRPQASEPVNEAPNPLERTVQELKGRVRQLAQERDAAQQKVGTLQAQVSTLDEQRNVDQKVLQELWELLTDNTRSVAKRVQARATAAADANVVDTKTSAPKEGAAAYNTHAVKDLLTASGGDFEAVVQQIVTSEGIDRLLQEHRDQPAYWTAAASFAPNPEMALEYLQEAARLHPKSPEVLTALARAQIAAGIVDESTQAFIQELENLDPTNALGDCYAAHCQFQNGDVASALQSLSEASAKGRFSDDQIETLMSRYEFLLNEGVTDSLALGMSAFALPLEHLGMIRQIEKQSMSQARTLTDLGQYDEALKIAQDVANLGSTISSSGRFLLHDRVGMALQEAGLTEQRKIYEALADTPQVQEVDEKLTAVQGRTEQVNTMVGAFGGVMATMTEDDLAAYVDATILHGEFATLQSIPAVDEAVKQMQAQKSPLDVASTTMPGTTP